MADLSAYIDFNVLLDNSGLTPVITLTDPGNYPGGLLQYITGVFSVTQADGISVSGNFISPDVTWNGSILTPNNKELRLATNLDLQNGIYSITYTVQCIGYVPTVLTKTFTLAYTNPTVLIDPLTDVFSPSLQVIDATQYAQTGFVTPTTTGATITRTWVASVNYIGTSISTINGTNQALFDMGSSGKYYDAQYNVSFSAIFTYTTPIYAYLTIKDQVSATQAVDAYTPASLSTLLAGLTTMKQQIAAGTYCGGGCSCGCDAETNSSFTQAQALYDYIVAQGQAGNTVGLYTSVIQLQALFICTTQLNQTHTGAQIMPYNFGTTVISSIHPPIQFTVGSGAQFAPNNGDTQYNNGTLQGNNNYIIYRQAQADFLVQGVDFNYVGTGGFLLLTTTFIATERFTLTFSQ